MTIGQKGFMEGDFPLWDGAVKRQHEEHFGGYAFMFKAGGIAEPELDVILRVPHQAAAFSSQGFQSR